MTACEDLEEEEKQVESDWFEGIDGAKEENEWSKELVDKRGDWDVEPIDKKMSWGLK